MSFPHSRVLTHDLRLKVYTTICENPASNLFTLLEKIKPKIVEKPFKVSQATFAWHLNKLKPSEENEGPPLVNYCQFTTLKGRETGQRLYFPEKLMHRDSAMFYYLIQSDIPLRILQKMLSPKCEELCPSKIAKEFNVHHETIRYHLDRLQQSGVIKLEKTGKSVIPIKGKNWHFFEKKKVIFITQEYIDFIVDYLKEDKPQILNQTEKWLFLQFEVSDKDHTIDKKLEIRLPKENWAINENLKESPTI